MFTDDQHITASEKNVAEYWKTINLMKLTYEHENCMTDTFRFIDGPPFVSGSLHMGSLSISFLKDTMLRFQRMHGKRCTNKIGFDCHGLPSENMVMKLLNLNSNAEIEKYGIDKFIAKCISTINEYSYSWEPIYTSIARQVDFKNQYKTIDLPFMETVWGVFKEIHKKGLVYKGYKVMPYSYACETPLSNFEAGLNYKIIQTNTIYIKFQLKHEINTYFVAWTTTPWTIPSNVALVVNPNIMYVKCYCKNNDVYIVSENAIQNLKMEFVKIEKYQLGKDLVGTEYIPLFSYLKFTYHKVLADDYVQDSTDIGTSIVHCAPAHGVDDYNVCSKNNVIDSKNAEQTCLVDDTGRFIKGTGNLEGELVFDTNKLIILMLKQNNMLVLTQNYSHEYPFCYRTETPLIYKLVSSYFIAVSQIKDKLIEMNDKINWSKPEIGQKRFGNWIKNPQDWSISRNRYFGTPIPIWEDDDETETIVVGSIEELVKLANLPEAPKDLHIDIIGKITIISPTTGKILKCNGNVFDCWFESGCVPYGQLHYPFENMNAFDNHEFLCDFIAEGLDQTRGWFYTLLVISTIISEKPAFKNVICTGLILDKNGNKLSKKNKNYVDPSLLIEKYGADMIRIYILSSQLLDGEPLMFNEDDIPNTYKRILPLKNAVLFFKEQITLLKTLNKSLRIFYVSERNIHILKENVMDKWILGKLTTMRYEVEKHMKEYHVNTAITIVINFIEDITNWYIKICRDRLKGKEGIQEQELSLSVLFTVLYDYTLILAPFAPYISEVCYQYMIGCYTSNENIDQTSFEILQFNKSVHLCQFHMQDTFTDLYRFEELKKIILAIRQVRFESKRHSSLRIPIRKCTIHCADLQYLETIKKIIEIAQEEVNCIEFDYNLIKEDMYVYKPIINMRSIGQKYKKKMNAVKNEIENLSQQELHSFDTLGNIMITIDDDDDYTLTKEDFKVIVETKLQPKQDVKIVSLGNITLEIDLNYDACIHDMGHAKMLVAFIQRMRKEQGLKPWDNIFVDIISASDISDNFMKKYKTYVELKIGKEIHSANDNFKIITKDFTYVNFEGKEDVISVSLYIS